jgi:kynurenine formamidase
MKITLSHNDIEYSVDLGSGVDLSIPFSPDSKLNAYHADAVRMEPFVMGDWIGEVDKGGPVNYRNIFFNPHGNGTHTECVGHIDRKIHSVNRHFKQFHSVAQVITVEPVNIDGDKVILLESLSSLTRTEAVIIRTVPNSEAKRGQNYSGTNPPYLDHNAVEHLVAIGCKHLILDLPSVDREDDGGKLAGHKAFWNYPDNPRMDCTITELAFIPESVKDGIYFLNLQVAPFENDAAPSRPVIFPMVEV